MYQGVKMTLSSEAIRKRRARAEGRVKPRPKKGPMSLEAMIIATEKSIATRLLRIAELEARGRDAQDNESSKWRQQIRSAYGGLRITENALRSLRRQHQITQALRDA